MANSYGHYKEVFKYATKGLLSAENNKNPTDNYNAFCLLFVILYGRRLVQSYGALFHMKFDDKIDITSTDDVYSKIKAELNRLDPPRIIEESLETMIHNKADKSCRYISKRSIGSLTMEDFYEVKEE